MNGMERRAYLEANDYDPDEYVDDESPYEYAAPADGYEDMIYCDMCESTVGVWGVVWQARLKGAKRDERGRALGWRCDSCADAIERGRDLY